jgi:hypothetical protein
MIYKIFRFFIIFQLSLLFLMKIVETILKLVIRHDKTMYKRQHNIQSSVHNQIYETTLWPIHSL